MSPLAASGRRGDLDKFGPYLVLEKIATGGMAELYRVRRPSDAAIFTLKCIRADCDDEAEFRNMLRDERYWFSRLGFYIERADNTARIMDVKYHVLLPEHSEVGGSLDYYQWSSILRSVSALTAYHWVYRQALKPWLIADLLILREEMPRSLASCYQNITTFLDEMARAYGKQGPAQRAARTTHSRLRNTRTEDVFQKGLHEFLTEFLADNNKLGAVIAEQYNLA